MCYRPLFCFNQFGDCEGAMLRSGNVHSSDNWQQVLDPILARYERTGVRRYFRADAAFAKPGVYEYLEGRSVLCAIRLPGNEVLQWEIAPLLRRPVGRSPKKPIIWSHIRDMFVQENHADVTHHHGEDDHIAFLERPLLEARRAVEERVAKGRTPVDGRHS